MVSDPPQQRRRVWILGVCLLVLAGCTVLVNRLVQPVEGVQKRDSFAAACVVAGLLSKCTATTGVAREFGERKDMRLLPRTKRRCPRYSARDIVRQYMLRTEGVPGTAHIQTNKNQPLFARFFVHATFKYRGVLNLLYGRRGEQPPANHSGEFLFDVDALEQNGLGLACWHKLFLHLHNRVYRRTRQQWPEMHPFRILVVCKQACLTAFVTIGTEYTSTWAASRYSLVRTALSLLDTVRGLPSIGRVATTPARDPLCTEDTYWYRNHEWCADSYHWRGCDIPLDETVPGTAWRHTHGDLASLLDVLYNHENTRSPCNSLDLGNLHPMFEESKVAEIDTMRTLGFLSMNEFLQFVGLPVFRTFGELEALGLPDLSAVYTGVDDVELYWIWYIGGGVHGTLSDGDMNLFRGGLHSPSTWIATRLTRITMAHTTSPLPRRSVCRYSGVPMPSFCSWTLRDREYPASTSYGRNRALFHR